MKVVWLGGSGVNVRGRDRNGSRNIINFWRNATRHHVAVANHISWWSNMLHDSPKHNWVFPFYSLNLTFCTTSEQTTMMCLTTWLITDIFLNLPNWTNSHYQVQHACSVAVLQLLLSCLMSLGKHLFLSATPPFSTKHLQIKNQTFTFI